MATVIYARKSSESNDRQVQSLDDQVRVLTEFARRENLPVSEVIQESRSAKLPGNRPEFSRLIRMVEDGKVDGILTWSPNRLSRNLVEGGMVSHLLQIGKLRFVRTPERIYRPEDNVLIMAVENGMATGYIQDLSRNVKRGMLGKCERGWFPGNPPIGYVNNPLSREIDPDPTTFPLVRKAWEMLLAGGTTVVAIHREMEKLGLCRTTRAGRQRPLTKAALFKLLRNPFYAGEFVYDGIRYSGKHRPLVTQAEFSKAQFILDGNKVLRPKDKPFRFSGTLRCRACGCAIVGERKVKRYKKTGRKAEYIYYHCSGAKGCSKTAIRAEDLWVSIEKFYKSLQFTDDFVEFLQEAMRKSLERERSSLAAASAANAVEARKLEGRKTKARALLLDGHITTGEYRSLTREVDAQISQLIPNAEIAIQMEGLVAESVMEVIKAAHNLANLSNLTDEMARGCLQCVGKNHTLTLGKLLLKPHPVVRIFTGLEPPIRCSQSGKLMVPEPQIQVWWTKVDEARTFARVHNLRPPLADLVSK